MALLEWAPRLAGAFLNRTLALSIVLAVSVLVAPNAGATADEEPGLGLDSVNVLAAEEVQEPVQISEVPMAPYFIGSQADAIQRRVAMVAGYISHYNKRLAAGEVSDIAQAIVQYSSRYGVDYRLLTSLIAVESAFRKDAVSSSGAIGMGQLKPDTAKWLGVVNPYDPGDNIAGTARFLAWLMRRYNGNLEFTLSAYYQGPGTVDRGGITPACVPYLEKINRALSGLL